MVGGGAPTGGVPLGSPAKKPVAGLSGAGPPKLKSEGANLCVVVEEGPPLL